MMLTNKIGLPQVQARQPEAPKSQIHVLTLDEAEHVVGGVKTNPKHLHGILLLSPVHT